MSKDSDSQIPKPCFSRPLTASAVANSLSPRHGPPRKRLYSDRSSNSPPSPEKNSKMAKEGDNELKDLILKLNTDMTNNMSTMKSDLKSQLSESEQRLGDKLENNFNQLTSQITDIRERQDDEVNLGNKVQE